MSASKLLAELAARRQAHWLPLRGAAQEAFAREIDRLLIAGADPCDGEFLGLGGGKSLLHVFAREPMCLNALLSAGLDPNGSDAQGQTPLHVLSSLHLDEQGQESVRALCRAGADLERRDAQGLTPAARACLRGTGAQTFFDLGADPLARLEDGSPCWTAWARSLFEFRRNVGAGFQLFLKQQGLAAWERSFDALAGLPGLDWSAHGGEFFAKAWEASCSIALRESPPPWRLALRSHARWMASCGAGIDGRDEQGWTALGKAAIYGDAEGVEVLLDLGAKVDERAADGSGHTALMGAAFNGRVDIARRLVEAGADPWLTDSSGQSAFEIAEGRADGGQLKAFWEQRQLDKSAQEAKPSLAPRL